eukprot:s983_g10.t1
MKARIPGNHISQPVYWDGLKNYQHMLWAFGTALRSSTREYWTKDPNRKHRTERFLFPVKMLCPCHTLLVDGGFAVTETTSRNRKICLSPAHKHVALIEVVYSCAR